MNPLLRAWLITGITDGLFSSVLVVAFYNSTFKRLWQGVASVPMGPSALESDAGMYVGLAMHFAVALAWTIVLWLSLRLNAMRQLLDSPLGPLKVAAFYGPLIWLVMSLALIPLFTHRYPAINNRWWIQFVGHIFFVALPMAWSLSNRAR